MIDTVKLTMAKPLPSSEELTSLGFVTSCGHSATCHHQISWRLQNKNGPNMRWTMVPNGISYLTVWASLPKLLFGNNVRMIETQAEIDAALVVLSDQITDVIQRDADTTLANVSRVDFCFNWYFRPSEVCQYL